jgi:transcriptional regulator with XRE-family HTH domain
MSGDYLQALAHPRTGFDFEEGIEQWRHLEEGCREDTQLERRWRHRQRQILGELTSRGHTVRELAGLLRRSPSRVQELLEAGEGRQDSGPARVPIRFPDAALDLLTTEPADALGSMPTAALATSWQRLGLGCSRLVKTRKNRRARQRTVLRKLADDDAAPYLSDLAERLGITPQRLSQLRRDRRRGRSRDQGIAATGVRRLNRRELKKASPRPATPTEIEAITVAGPVTPRRMSPEEARQWRPTTRPKTLTEIQRDGSDVR